MTRGARGGAIQAEGLSGPALVWRRPAAEVQVLATNAESLSQIRFGLDQNPFSHRGSPFHRFRMHSWVTCSSMRLVQNKFYRTIQTTQIMPATRWQNHPMKIDSIDQYVI